MITVILYVWLVPSVVSPALVASQVGKHRPPLSGAPLVEAVWLSALLAVGMAYVYATADNVGAQYVSAVLTGAQIGFTVAIVAKANRPQKTVTAGRAGIFALYGLIEAALVIFLLLNR